MSSIENIIMMYYFVYGPFINMVNEYRQGKTTP